MISFLDLMASSSSSFFVPTIDIDLAWHTHQLQGSRYHDKCYRLVGQYVDQYVKCIYQYRKDLTRAPLSNDKVEENLLANCFDDTCKAWKTRFGAQYTFCGCPAPASEKPKTKFWGLNHTKTDAAAFYGPYLTPPNSTNSTIQAATHASDHDATYNNRYVDICDKCRLARLEKREKLLDEGLGVKKSFNFKKGKANERTTPNTHPIPFFPPIPQWYLNSDGISCAAYAANLLDSFPVDADDEVCVVIDNNTIALANINCRFQNSFHILQMTVPKFGALTCQRGGHTSR
jgi:hypothetical protein